MPLRFGAELVVFPGGGGGGKKGKRGNQGPGLVTHSFLRIKGGGMGERKCSARSKRTGRNVEGRGKKEDGPFLSSLFHGKKGEIFSPARHRAFRRVPRTKKKGEKEKKRVDHRGGRAAPVRAVLPRARTKKKKEEGDGLP